jgi:hypothetical protein
MSMSISLVKPASEKSPLTPSLTNPSSTVAAADDDDDAAAAEDDDDSDFDADVAVKTARSYKYPCP